MAAVVNDVGGWQGLLAVDMQLSDGLATLSKVCNMYGFGAGLLVDVYVAIWAKDMHKGQNGDACPQQATGAVSLNGACGSISRVSVASLTIACYCKVSLTVQ